MIKKILWIVVAFFLISFQINRPSEIAFFDVYSDSESLTDLQRSSISKILKLTVEQQCEMTLLPKSLKIEMPLPERDVREKIVEYLNENKIRYGVFGWLEAGERSSRLKVYLVDSQEGDFIVGSAAYPTRYAVYEAIIPAVEDLENQIGTNEEPTQSAAYIPRQWLKIKDGFFKMGEDYHRADNQPQHEVYVDSFWADPYEVTVAEFRQFVEETGYYISGGAFIHDQHKRMVFDKELNFENPGYEVHERMPVSCVSWIDALHYCNWKSQKRGLTPVYEINENGVLWNREANGYRLPTEAEWEYAASGGELHRRWIFSGSDNISTVAIHAANSGGSPAIVGTLKPNQLGLYDMSGNVFEWCWDIYDETYYSQSLMGENPLGPKEGSYRVYRGGSWLSPPMICLVFNRLSNNPQLRSNLVGFRLVRSGSDVGFDVTR